jgi:hypothetical protein
MNPKARLLLIAAVILAIFTALNIVKRRKNVANNPSNVASNATKSRGAKKNQKVHLIGTAKGKPLPGEDTRVWWEKCPNIREDRSGDCHRKYAGETYKTSVDVTLKDLSGDVILVAMSTETKTRWDIRNLTQAKLVKVILLGNHEQTVSGIGSNTQVEVYTREPSPCDGCYRGPPAPITTSFDESLLTVLDSIRSITSHDPVSVQLVPATSDFFISDQIRSFDRSEFEFSLKQKKCESLKKTLKEVEESLPQQRDKKDRDYYTERLNNLRSQFKITDCAP